MRLVTKCPVRPPRRFVVSYTATVCVPCIRRVSRTWLRADVTHCGVLCVCRWLRDNLGLISEYSEVEKLAREVTDTGGVYFVPAFTGLYAPHWDSTARG